jgi:uncharacterized protein YbaR (Trm112 family)
MDARLLEIVVCPRCHSSLTPAPTDAPLELRCGNPECALVYPVRDGIPVLLVDEAERADRSR